MRAFKFVIPIMIIVAWASWLMLSKNFTDVPEQTRLYITIGAVVDGEIIAQGKAFNKKDASQIAASLAVHTLGINNNEEGA